MKVIFATLAIVLSWQTTFALPQSFKDTKTEGVPLVFIHAFPMNQEMWNDQVEFFKKTNRVITFDVRGLGKDKRFSPYTLELVVDDLIELLDKLKVEKIVVCGLSMGGFIALRAIERNPERFRALILADTKAEPDSDSSKLGRYKGLREIESKGTAEFVEGFLKKSIAPSLQTSESKVFSRAKKIASANKREGISAALVALATRTDTTGALSKISVPTLILQGEHDSVIPLESVKLLNEKIKGSKLFMIAGAGHLSNLEQPAIFNEQVKSFLSGLKN